MKLNFRKFSKSHGIIVFVVLFFFSANGCTENNNPPNVLDKVLSKLKKIESASFQLHIESWNPGDTVYAFAQTNYVESYRNKEDSTIGAIWAKFENSDKKKLNFAYDGKMRTLIYDYEKRIVIDSFKVRKLPFRPISPPFYFYAESIIEYILENKDETTIISEETKNYYYIRLTINEDRQVEFFGKAYYLPKSEYVSDPKSIYEIWISKENYLPYKIRREMSHNINVSSVTNSTFNKLNIEDFHASDYFPKDYKVTQYKQKENRKQLSNMVGQKAPFWSLLSADNKWISLTDIKSKVLLLEFTSVSCGPCNASIRFLKQLPSLYEEKDFDLVAIESTSKNINVLKKYMKRNNFDYKFLLSNKEVLADYSIRSFPVFMILDENRVIRNVVNGYGKGTTDKKIIDLINNLL